jgi:ketosteroid isomerase-like protein
LQAAVEGSRHPSLSKDYLRYEVQLSVPCVFSVVFFIFSKFFLNDYYALLINQLGTSPPAIPPVRYALHVHHQQGEETEMTQKLSRFFRSIFILAIGAALASSAFAQNKKKSKKEEAAAAQAATDNAIQKLPDQDKIDFVISEMLGAWQIGDITKLHQDIADDVIVVNGMWAPPVVGWTNYLASYQAQRARTQQIRMDRSNTLIRVTGNFASACYQWDFSAIVDGQQSGARGQTTLLLEKRADKWIIVLNHTSIVETGTPVGTVPQAQPPAAPKP